MVRLLLVHFTYGALLALLLAAGMGVPLPEDLTLLTGGALARQGLTSLWITMAVGYVGVVLGDLLIFRTGRRLGPRMDTQSRLRRVLTPERRRKAEAWFAKYGALTVVAGRHTPGLRAPIFLVAGSSGMRTRTFLIADALSAVLTTPLVVWLGYLLADNLVAARKRIHHVELWLALAAAVLLGGYWLLRRRGRARRKREVSAADDRARPA